MGVPPGVKNTSIDQSEISLNPVNQFPSKISLAYSFSMLLVFRIKVLLLMLQQRGQTDSSFPDIKEPDFRGTTDSMVWSRR